MSTNKIDPTILQKCQEFCSTNKVDPTKFLHCLKMSGILQYKKVDPTISTLRGMKAVTNISVEKRKSYITYKNLRTFGLFREFLQGKIFRQKNSSRKIQKNNSKKILKISKQFFKKFPRF